MGEWHVGPWLRHCGIWSRSQVPLPGHRSQTGRRPGKAASAHHLEVKCLRPSASPVTAVTAPSVQHLTLLLATRQDTSSNQSNHSLFWLKLYYSVTYCGFRTAVKQCIGTIKGAFHFKKSRRYACLVSNWSEQHFYTHWVGLLAGKCLNVSSWPWSFPEIHQKTRFQQWDYLKSALSSSKRSVRFQCAAGWKLWHNISSLASPSKWNVLSLTAKLPGFRNKVLYYFYSVFKCYLSSKVCWPIFKTDARKLIPSWANDQSGTVTERLS